MLCREPNVQCWSSRRRKERKKRTTDTESDEHFPLSLSLSFSRSRPPSKKKSHWTYVIPEQLGVDGPSSLSCPRACTCSTEKRDRGLRGENVRSRRVSPLRLATRSRFLSRTSRRGGRRTLIFAQRTSELIDGGRDLETLVENLALTLNSNVSRPSHETR